MDQTPLKIREVQLEIPLPSIFFEEFLLPLQSPSTSPPLLCLASWFPNITVLEEPVASSFRVKGSGRWVRFGGVTLQKTVILLPAAVKISHCNKFTRFIKGGKWLVLSSFSIILFLGILSAAAQM
jgi:hypothetical protein